MDVASDNAAALACEVGFTHLEREGCAELQKLALRDFNNLPYGELNEDVAKVQVVKAAIFQRFWLDSGKDAMRALGAAQIEAVGVPTPGGYC